jgi:hypothetical protein
MTKTKHGGLPGLLWVLAAMGITSAQAQTAPETVLHNSGGWEGRTWTPVPAGPVLPE